MSLNNFSENLISSVKIITLSKKIKNTLAKRHLLVILETFHSIFVFYYLNAATFIPSSKSFLLGLKNLVPLKLEPKKTHPPVQPHFPTDLFKSGHRNHNFLNLSSWVFKNFCCIPEMFCSFASVETADSIIRGPKFITPTSNHKSQLSEFDLKF